MGTSWPAAFLYLCIGVCSVGDAYGLKFLILHPFYSGSHMLTLHHIGAELVSRGHQVVTLRFTDFHHFRLKPLGPEHREIQLALNNSDGLLPFMTVDDRSEFQLPVHVTWHKGLSLSTLLSLPGNPWTLVRGYCDQLLGNATLRAYLQAEQFHLAIVDLIYNECGLALAHSLQLPSVGYWGFSFSSGEAELTTVATPPSHIPCFMSELTQTMSFWQRVYNFAIKAFFARPFMYYHTSVINSVLAKFFDQSFPSSEQLLADLNGLLINSHSVIDYPRLMPPDTFINIGGVQIPKQTEPSPLHYSTQLSEQLFQWIEGAQHGVILFTMGFIFSPESVPAERIEALFEAFSRLPQRFIVKLDSWPEEKIPENVLIQSFVPQQIILSHPKTKLFMTHCGMHGVMEAIYHAVPMVGMPVFIDQGDVLARILDKGIGVGLSKWATAQEIQLALETVRDDIKYKDNVLQLSQQLKLQQASRHPMDEAVWLIEFLAKSKGAPHLRLQSRHLNFFQYYSLDVMAFLLLMLMLLVKLVLSIANLCSRKKPGPHAKDKKL